MQVAVLAGRQMLLQVPFTRVPPLAYYYIGCALCQVLQTGKSTWWYGRSQSAPSAPDVIVRTFGNAPTARLRIFSGQFARRSMNSSGSLVEVRCMNAPMVLVRLFSYLWDLEIWKAKFPSLALRPMDLLSPPRTSGSSERTVALIEEAWLKATLISWTKPLFR